MAFFYGGPFRDQIVGTDEDDTFVMGAGDDLAGAFRRSPGIGTPAEFRAHLATFEDAGVDQIILLQQAGRNRHDHICEALDLLGREIIPQTAPKAIAREQRKADELASYIAAALARKQRLPPLTDADIPIVKATVAKPVVNQTVNRTA